MIGPVDGTPEQIDAALKGALVTLIIERRLHHTGQLAVTTLAMFTESSIMAWAEANGFSTHCEVCAINSWFSKLIEESKRSSLAMRFLATFGLTPIDLLNN